MGKHNEPSDRTLSTEERLVKRYFWFLVDEYGLKYEKYTFRSKKMLIEVQVGHKTDKYYYDYLKNKGAI